MSESLSVRPRPILAKSRYNKNGEPVAASSSGKKESKKKSVTLVVSEPEAAEEEKTTTATDFNNKSKFTLISHHDVEQQSKSRRNKNFLRLQAAAWGWNSERRAGNVTAVSIPFPRQLQRTQDFCFISGAAGKHHALFITNTGNVYSIGDGRQGQLGYGNLFTGMPVKGGETQATPRHVTPSGILKFGRDLQSAEVAAGGTFSLSREINPFEASKSVTGFLSLEAVLSYYLQLFPDSLAIRHAFSIARQERCVINHRAEGKVLVWGTGKHGELGLGSDHLYTSFPVLNYTLNRVVVRQIAAGSRHALAITEQGHLFSWGMGKGGRLGHGDFDDRHSPEIVRFCLSMQVVYIAAGDAHSAILTMPREDAYTIVQQPLSLIHAQSIYAQGEDAYQGMLRGITRKILCFGRGAHGRLGHGTNRNSPLPVVVKVLPPSVAGAQIVAVACGGAHTLALLHKAVPKSLVYGKGIRSYVVAWGYGSNGQLGTGYDVDSFVPVKVRLPKHELILQVSAGRSWSMGRAESGQLYTWGKGILGQLGQGARKGFSLAPRVTQPTLGDAHVLHISAGYAHNVAIYVSRRRHLITEEEQQQQQQCQSETEREDDEDDEKERLVQQRKKKAISSFAQESKLFRGPLEPELSKIQQLLTPGALSIVGHVSESLYQIDCCRRWKAPVYCASSSTSSLPSHSSNQNTAATSSTHKQKSPDKKEATSENDIHKQWPLADRRWRCLDCGVKAMCFTCLRLCHRGHHVKILDPRTAALHPDHRADNADRTEATAEGETEISMSSKDAMRSIYKDAKRRWETLRVQSASVPTAFVWLPNRLKMRIRDLYLPHSDRPPLISETSKDNPKDENTADEDYIDDDGNLSTTGNNRKKTKQDPHNTRKFYHIHTPASTVRTETDYDDELQWITLDKSDPKVLKQIRETKEYRARVRAKRCKALNSSLEMNSLERLPRISIYVTAKPSTAAPSASFIPTSMKFHRKESKPSTAGTVPATSASNSPSDRLSMMESSSVNSWKRLLDQRFLAGSCKNGTRSIARPVPMTYLSHPDHTPTTFFSDMYKRKLYSCEFRIPPYVFPFFAKYQTPVAHETHSHQASTSSSSSSSIRANSMHVHRHMFYRIDTEHVDESIMRARRQAAKERGVYHANRIVTYLAEMEYRDLDVNARLLLQMQQQAMAKNKQEKARVQFATDTARDLQQNLDRQRRGRSVSPSPSSRDGPKAPILATRSRSLPPPPKPSAAAVAASNAAARLRRQNLKKTRASTVAAANATPIGAGASSSSSRSHPFLSALLTSGSINITRSLMASRIVDQPDEAVDRDQSTHAREGGGGDMDTDSILSQHPDGHSVMSQASASSYHSQSTRKPNRKQGFTAQDVQLLGRVYYRREETHAQHRYPDAHYYRRSDEVEAVSYCEDPAAFFTPAKYLEVLSMLSRENSWNVVTLNNVSVKSSKIPTTTPSSSSSSSTITGSARRFTQMRTSAHGAFYLQQQNRQQQFLLNLPFPDLRLQADDRELRARSRTVWAVWSLADLLLRRHVQHLRREASRMAHRQHRRSGGSVELRTGQIDYAHIHEHLRRLEAEEHAKRSQRRDVDGVHDVHDHETKPPPPRSHEIDVSAAARRRTPTPKWIVACHCSLFGMDRVLRDVDHYLLPTSAKLYHSSGHCRLLPSMHEGAWEHLSHLHDPLFAEDEAYDTWQAFVSAHAPMQTLHPLAMQAATQAMVDPAEEAAQTKERKLRASMALQQSMKSLYEVTLSPASAKHGKSRKSIQTKAHNNSNKGSVKMPGVMSTKTSLKQAHHPSTTATSNKMFGRLFTSHKTPLANAFSSSSSSKKGGAPSDKYGEFDGDEEDGDCFDPVAYQQAQIVRNNVLQSQYPSVYAQYQHERRLYDAAVQIQRMGRGLVCRKRYLQQLQQHILVRRQVCTRYWHETILGTVMDVVAREWQRAQEAEECQRMYYEDQLTQRFTQYQRTQSALMGFEAMHYGMRQLLGKASILIPVVDEAGVPMRWCPSFCFSFDALRDVLLRRPPLRRMFTPVQWAEIAQFYPRFADAPFKKEAHAYMSDPDMIRLFSRYVVTKQRNAIRVDRLLVQETNRKIAELARLEAAEMLKRKHETALQRAQRLMQEQKRQQTQGISGEGNNHQGDSAIEALKRLKAQRLGSGPGGLMAKNHEGFEGYRPPGGNCWKELMIYQARLLPPLDCDEYLIGKIAPLPTKTPTSLILAEEQAERDRQQLLKQQQWEKEQYQKQRARLIKHRGGVSIAKPSSHAGTKTAATTTTTAAAAAAMTAANASVASRPSSSATSAIDSRPNTTNSTRSRHVSMTVPSVHSRPSTSQLTATNRPPSSSSTSATTKRNAGGGDVGGGLELNLEALEPYYFPYDPMAGPQSYKCSTFSVFRPIYQPPFWTYRRHSITDPCQLYQRTLVQPKLIRGRAFLKRTYSCGPGIFSSGMKNYLLEQDLDAKQAAREAAAAAPPSKRDKPKKDAYGYLEDVEANRKDPRRKLLGSTTRISPYVSMEHVHPEDRLKVLEAFRHERLRLKEEHEQRCRELQRALQQQKKQQEEENARRRASSVNGSHPGGAGGGARRQSSHATPTVAAPTPKPSATTSAASSSTSINAAGATTTTIAMHAFPPPPPINIYAMSLPTVAPLKQFHRQRKTEIANSLSLFAMRTQFLSDFRENVATWAKLNDGSMFVNRRPFIHSQFKQTLIESCLFMPRLPRELNEWIRQPRRRRSLGGPAERYAQQLEDVLCYREIAQEALGDGFTECVLPRRTRSFDFGEARDAAQGDILRTYLGFTTEYHLHMDEDERRGGGVKQTAALRHDAIDMQERILAAGFLQREQDERAQSRREEKRRRQQARQRRRKMRGSHSRTSTSHGKHGNNGDDDDNDNDDDDDDDDDDDEGVLAEEDAEDLVQSIRLARESVRAKYFTRRGLLRAKRAADGGVGGGYIAWLQAETLKEQTRNVAHPTNGNHPDQQHHQHHHLDVDRDDDGHDGKRPTNNKKNILTRHKVSLEQSQKITVQQQQQTRKTSDNKPKKRPPPPDFSQYLGMITEGDDDVAAADRTFMETSNQATNQSPSPEMRTWQEHVYSVGADGQAQQYYYFHPYSGTSVWTARDMYATAMSWFDARPAEQYAQMSEDALEDVAMHERGYVSLERQYYDAVSERWYWFNATTGTSHWVSSDVASTTACNNYNNGDDEEEEEEDGAHNYHHYHHQYGSSSSANNDGEQQQPPQEGEEAYYGY